MTYSDVSWDTTTLDDCSISNGWITGLGTTDTWGSKAQTTDTFTSGKIQIEINPSTFQVDPGARAAFGFGVDPFGTTPGTIEHRFYYYTGSLRIYESGSLVYTNSTTLTSSDKLYIEFLSTGVSKYYLNSTLLYTGSFDNTLTYYAHFTPNQAASVYIKKEGGSGGSGGGGTYIGSNPIEGEGQILDHILYMQTVVPR